MERKGIPRGLATFLCILLLIASLAGLGTILSVQIASFSDQLPQIEKQLNQQLTDLQRFVSNTFGVSPEKQEKMIKEGSSSGLNSAGTAAALILGSLTSILGNSLLALVYLFMLIYYRSRFVKFILKLMPDDQKEEARRVIYDSAQVAQQYLVGRGLLIINLAVLYSIGLSIIGLQNAILFSVIAALFSIIPYVGNIVGISFPLFMALTQGGGSWTVLGVLIVFSIVQFVESYTLEPYVVGAEVDIHPFFTIAIIIVGELVWGIAGMILAIPLLGMVKIVFSHIEPLKPYAYLIGGTEKENKPSFKERVKGWFS